MADLKPDLRLGVLVDELDDAAPGLGLIVGPDAGITRGDAPFR